MTGSGDSGRSEFAMRAHLYLEVADARPVKVLGSTADARDGSRFLSVDHGIVDLVLMGTPTKLRAWAEQLIEAADRLAVEEADVKAAG